MSGRATEPRRRARLAAGAIAIIGAAYLVLAGIVLNPRTFFDGDPGVKYLQAYNAAEARWRSLAVRNPAEHIDPERRFSALAGNQFAHRPGGPDYGLYSELFTVPVSVALATFGLRGMYLVPMIAALGAMILTYRLSVRTAPQFAWLAPVLVGACSPMAFYAVELWEHTLAVLFSTASVSLVVAGTERAEVRRFFLAGVLLGVAISLREELYAMLPAGLVALAWVERRRRLPVATAALAGTLVALAPHWLLQWEHIGLPGRIATIAVPLTKGLPSSLSLMPVVGMVLPHSAALVMLVGVAVAIRFSLTRVARRWRPWLFVGLAVLTAAWAAADALLLVHTWNRPDSVLRAFPAALFLLFLPGPVESASSRRREIGQLLAIAAIFTAVVCGASQFSVTNPEPGGPEWGPRYLLPLYPLLAVAIVFALERRGDWTAHAPSPSGLVVVLFAAVTLASGAVQAQGIRLLYGAKDAFEQVVAATEAVDASDVIVTDLWWFAPVTATVLNQHEVVSVDVDGNGPLRELLAQLARQNVTALTFVTEGRNVSDASAAALTGSGWIETKRRSVRVWTDVEMVSYRRDQP